MPEHVGQGTRKNISPLNLWSFLPATASIYKVHSMFAKRIRPWLESQDQEAEPIKDIKKIFRFLSNNLYGLPHTKHELVLSIVFHSKQIFSNSHKESNS